MSPMLWGVEADVVERFGAAGVAPQKIAFARETFTFETPHAPTDFLGVFRDFYGPTMNAFDAARKDGREADLQRELGSLFESRNQSGRNDFTSIRRLSSESAVTP